MLTMQLQIFRCRPMACSKAKIDCNFLFIFIGQPTGIGFLVAAKSILRFEEAKEQKLAEYVLIGSLLSFSTAIAMSAATRWAMGL